MKETVVARLVGWPRDSGTTLELTKAVDAPPLIVHHVLNLCQAKRLVTLSSNVARPRFFGISPRLRRLATP